MSLFSLKLTTKVLYDKCLSSLKFLVGNGHHYPRDSDLDDWLLHPGQVFPVANATSPPSPKQEPLNLTISPLLQSVVCPSRPIAPATTISIGASELPTRNFLNNEDLPCPPAALTKLDFPGSLSIPTLSQQTSKEPSVIDNESFRESRPTKRRRTYKELPNNDFRCVTRSQTKQLRVQDTVQASSASGRAAAAKHSSSKRPKKSKARSRSATLTAKREPQDSVISTSGQRPTTTISDDETPISITKLSLIPPLFVSASLSGDAANQGVHAHHISPSSSPSARAGPESVSVKKRLASTIDSDNAEWSRPPSPPSTVAGSLDRTIPRLTLPSDSEGLESLSEREQVERPISAIDENDAEWSRSPSPPSTVNDSPHLTMSELSMPSARAGMESLSDMEQGRQPAAALDNNNGKWWRLPSPSPTATDSPAWSTPELMSTSVGADPRYPSGKVLGKRRAVDDDNEDDKGYASMSSSSPSGDSRYANPQATNSTQSHGGPHSCDNPIGQKFTSEKGMESYKQPFKGIKHSTLGDDDELDLNQDDSDDDDDDDDEMSFFEAAATATAEPISDNSKLDIWTQYRSQPSSPRVKYVSERALGKRRAISTDANNEGCNLVVPTRTTVNAAQLHVLDQRLPQLQASPPHLKIDFESSSGTVLGKRPAVAVDGDGSGCKSEAENHLRKKARTATNNTQSLGPADTRKEVLNSNRVRRRTAEAQYALVTIAEFKRLFCTSPDNLGSDATEPVANLSWHRQGAPRGALSMPTLEFARARGITEEQLNNNDRWSYLCSVVRDDLPRGHLHSQSTHGSPSSEQAVPMATLAKLGRKWQSYANFISWGPKSPKSDKNRRAKWAAHRRMVLHKSLVNLFIDKQSLRLLPFVNESARCEYFKFRLRNTDACRDWMVSMEAISKMLGVADARIDRKPS